MSGTGTGRCHLCRRSGGRHLFDLVHGEKGYESMNVVYACEACEAWADEQPGENGVCYICGGSADYELHRHGAEPPATVYLALCTGCRRDVVFGPATAVRRGGEPT